MARKNIDTKQAELTLAIAASNINYRVDIGKSREQIRAEIKGLLPGTDYRILEAVDRRIDEAVNTFIHSHHNMTLRALEAIGCSILKPRLQDPGSPEAQGQLDVLIESLKAEAAEPTEV